MWIPIIVFATHNSFEYIMIIYNVCTYMCSNITMKWWSGCIIISGILVIIIIEYKVRIFCECVYKINNVDTNYNMKRGKENLCWGLCVYVCCLVR